MFFFLGGGVLSRFSLKQYKVRVKRKNRESVVLYLPAILLASGERSVSVCEWIVDSHSMPW